MDTQAAIRFVSSYGNPIEQARLRFTLAGEPASQDESNMLLAGQRRDGGWSPFWATDYSSLDATCFRLAQASQLGIGMAEPSVALAVRFLEERQATRGSWEEDAAAAALAPPWAIPGDLAAQLYLTANCGYWLAMLNPKSPAGALGSSFLLLHLEPSGQLPTFLHAHWLAAGLWICLEKSAPAKIVLSQLLKQLPQLTSSSLAWMVTSLCQAGLSGKHELIRQAVSLIARHQQPDGRWSSEDGPARDVHATLEALLAIKLAGA
jgi:hypothetical protein